MAARIGYDPSFLVKNPIKTQLLALGAGAIGNALTRKNSTDVTMAATLAPILLVQALRRHELKKIQRKYDEEDRVRLRKLDVDELFDDGWGGGSSRLGAVTAYETMRKRKYRGYGSLAESGDALQLAAGLVHPALYPASIPVISGVDNSAADRMLNKKGAAQLLKALPKLFKAAPKTLGNSGGRVGNFLTAAKLKPGYKDFRAARKTFDFVSPKSMPNASGRYGMHAAPRKAMDRGLAEMKQTGYRGSDGWYRPPNLAKGRTRGLAVVNPYRLPKGREFGPAIRNTGRHEITHGYQDAFSAQGKNFPIWNTAAKGMNSRHSPLQAMVTEQQAFGAGGKGLLAGAKELVRSAPEYGRLYGEGSKAYAIPWNVLGMLGRPKALAAAVGGGIGVGVGGPLLAERMLRKKGAAQLLGKGIKAFRGLAVKSTPKATRIPAGSSIPTSMAENMEKVMEVNSRISGRRGYGALKSVDDVSRKNPHMSYMGSFERSLPWAKGPKGATPVLDAFHVGPKGAVTTGGREMSPMAMRQRWRTGYDTKGKAIYDKSAEEVLMQPMYRSSGTGSGTSSAGKWVPFDKYYAPHHSKKYVDQLANTRGMDPAQAAYYRRNMPVSDLIEGTDGLSPWVGKYANTVGADGRIVREALVHKDDVVRGVFNQQYSKEGLPRHLEGVQELMNNYYGGLSKMGAAVNADVEHIEKKADFSEQRNSPALPLYILAALASSAGMAGARQWAHTEGGNTPPLAKEKWPELIRSISGTSPAVYSAPGMNNAFFAKPRTESEALAFMRHADRWEDLTPKSPDVGFVSPYRKKMDRVRRLLRHGAVAADSNSGAPTLAHEGGHAKIEETPGILRALQRHVYPHSRWVAPLAGAGSMAAGLASGGPLKGALLGTGIGALAGLGMVGPEAGASWNAAKGLKGYEGGAHTGHTGKDLLSALSTYLAATVLPSTLSGAAGGYIAGRRKKKEEEQEKAATAKPTPLAGRPGGIAPESTPLPALLAGQPGHIAPAKVISPYYGKNFQAEVAKAQQYNSGPNKTLPSDAYGRLNTPVSVSSPASGTAKTSGILWI
tara:strand:+ start:2153 stop:5335 length:3183 start_codon:yes stop_codon:yes gene_type:complete